MSGDRSLLNLVCGVSSIGNFLVAALQVDGARASKAVQLAELAPTGWRTRTELHFAIGFSFKEQVVQEHGGRNHDELLGNSSLALERHLVLVRIRKHRAEKTQIKI